MTILIVKTALTQRLRMFLLSTRCNDNLILGVAVVQFAFLQLGYG